MTFFSVVIPVYNREYLVKEAIESVLQQSFQDFEIIVINDGSTDSTKQTLDTYKGKIEVIHKENGGAGAARNAGINRSKGRYIAFLDCDDLWLPWTLSSYYEAIVQSDFPSFVSGTSKIFSSTSELDKSLPQDDLFYTLHKNYFLCSQKRVGLIPSSSAVKTSEIIKIGGFSSQRGQSDERVAEDADLWMKLGNSKGFVFIESPPLALYRRHQDNMMGSILKDSLGILFLIQNEKEGKYPGGKELYLDRIKLITKCVRPFSVVSLQNKKFDYAIRIYRETFWWHTRILKLSYLIGFIPATMFYAVQHSLEKVNLSFRRLVH